VATTDALARALEATSSSLYLLRLGTVVRSAGGGEAEVGLSHDDAIFNRAGSAHGGAIATCAIAAASIAAASTESDATPPRLLTLNLSYLRAVRGVGPTARARVLDRGRNVLHVAADVYGSDARSAATALLTFGADAPGSSQKGETPRPWLDPTLARTIAAATPRRMSRSPYGRGAAIEILHEAPRAVAVRMPLAPNQGAQGVVHAGAVAGLIDTCGAFSSYLEPGVGFDRSGATIAMSVAYLATVAGDLDGYSRLIARAGTMFANHVQVWGRTSGVLAATGTVSYRISES
jgi:uncharacterized protein (TIGR00369 family)